MSMAILGIGTAVPATEISREQALAIAQRICPTPHLHERLADLSAHSGIERRFSVLGEDVVRDVLTGTRESGSVFVPDGRGLGPTTGQRMRIYKEQAPRLALSASQAALANAGVPASAITHLVTVSCTGFSAPGLDVSLIESLGLAPGVERTHVGFMGCHAALNGLRLARAFAEADPDACVLLCAVELCSLHYDYGAEMQKLVSNALFADGAAALVGAASAKSNENWRVVANGSCLVPDSRQAMTWNIGDHGFDMTLATRLPRLIETNLRGWLGQWLARNGLTMSDVGSWAVHPGGPKILDAVAAGLELPASALAESRAVLAEYGNMSSPTILFIVDRLWRRQAPRACVALGFGPGLTVEAALIE